MAATDPSEYQFHVTSPLASKFSSFSTDKPASTKIFQTPIDKIKPYRTKIKNLPSFEDLNEKERHDLSARWAGRIDLDPSSESFFKAGAAIDFNTLQALSAKASATASAALAAASEFAVAVAAAPRPKEPKPETKAPLDYPTREEILKRQQEISSSSTSNLPIMSQSTGGISNTVPSKPHSSVYFDSDHYGASLTPVTANSNDQSATATASSVLSALARLISEHMKLVDRFSLCLSVLQGVFNDVEILRQENTNLRLTNRDFVDKLSALLEAATFQAPATFSEPLVPGSRFSSGEKKITEENEGGAWEEKVENTSESPTTVIENESNNQQKVEEGRASLPKSISVSPPDVAVPTINYELHYKLLSDKARKALEYYKDTKDEESELVEMGENFEKSFLYPYWITHITFTAKPKDIPHSCPKLFFAEVYESFEHLGEYQVKMCMTMDPSGPDVMKGCGYAEHDMLHPKGVKLWAGPPSGTPENGIGSSSSDVR